MSEEIEEAMELDTGTEETFTTPPESIVTDMAQKDTDLETEESGKAETTVKKRRKSKKKPDGYNKRKRSKSVQQQQQQQQQQQDPEEYEVEMILDHKVEKDGSEFYLVHWKGWSDDDDSWVRVEDCQCPDLIAEFYRKFPDKAPKELAIAETETNNTEEEEEEDEESIKLKNYIESLLKPSEEDIDKAIKMACGTGGKSALNGFKLNMTNEDINKYAVMVFGKRQKLLQMERNLMMLLLTRDFRERRSSQLQRIKDWEDELNKVTLGKPPLRVENNVDLDEPPMSFKYVNQCMAGEGVSIPDDPLIGCECLDCIDNRKSCCGPMSGTQSAYTKNGKLRVPVGTPIYECNSRCRCGPECPNRVVQRGTKLKLCIFRTSNGRGWGVKTLEAIKKNSFVIEYVGEVITTEEAEKRGVQYDSEGRTYLFDLDFNDIDCAYSIDAAHMGNVSHFINHSCDPNLAVFAMWANCLDPNMPRLALFAHRDIHSGEELTFDYASSKTEQTEGKEGEVVNTEITSKNECRCGAANCRKIMFSLPGSQVIPSFSITDAA